MSIMEGERELDIWGREVKDIWKGPWCSGYRQGGKEVYVRHVAKNGEFERERIVAYPEKGGIKYRDLPE